MSDEDVKNMVARHDEAINHVTGSIERLATAVEKTDDKMDKVIEALSQNAVILEKIANIDSSNKDSVNRLHRRIDDTLILINQKEKNFENALGEIKMDAKKGGKLFDIALYTVKAMAWTVPIIGALLAVLMYIISNSVK